MVLTSQLLRELKVLRPEGPCTRFKDHSEKSHKPFNKTRSFVKTLIVTRPGLFLQEKAMLALLGLVKVHLQKRLHSLILSDQFCAQETNLLASKKVRKLNHSGLHLVERPNTALLRTWV